MRAKTPAALQGPAAAAASGAPAEAPQPAPAPRMSCASVLLCAFYGLCIVGTLLVYGLWQERIMSQPYGDVDRDGQDDFFTFSVALVLFSRVVGVVFAFVMVIGVGESLSCQAPLWKYTLVSISNVAASICQYEALKYVSFTMQILGKSFKMVPVMLWGVTCMGKRYRFLDWIVSFGVTGGVVWYMVGGNFAPDHSDGKALWGLLLLLSFIVLDGFSATFQEKLFADHRLSKYNQMLHINVTSAMLSLATLAISTQAKEAFDFSQSHPMVYVDAGIMSGSAVVAQWFVYSQVQDFGQMAFAATMNLRQIISIVASYVVYSHSIAIPQIAGLSVVFGALSFQSIQGMLSSGSDESKPLVEGRKGKAEPGAGVIFLRRTGLASCMPCAGGRDAAV